MGTDGLAKGDTRNGGSQRLGEVVLPPCQGLAFTAHLETAIHLLSNCNSSSAGFACGLCAARMKKKNLEELSIHFTSDFMSDRQCGIQAQ